MMKLQAGWQALLWLGCLHSCPGRSHLRRASSSFRFCSARFILSSFSDLSIALDGSTRDSHSHNSSKRQLLRDHDL